ncbi:MAG: OmpH family outer membrane protein [Xanthomonadales bacterium]|nr:OmpH family outer membrane protein [Xanthomonadales bacterium]
MNRFICVLSAALFVTLLSSPVSVAADINIGVVSYQRLMVDAPQARSLQQALEAEFAPRQRSLKDKETELQGNVEKLRRDAAVMSDSERRDAERDLRDQQMNLLREREELAEDFSVKRNAALAELQRSLVEEVQSYARGQGYDLIIGEGVVFASESIDVTAEVLANLQRSFESSN